MFFVMTKAPEGKRRNKSCCLAKKFKFPNTTKEMYIVVVIKVMYEVCSCCLLKKYMKKIIIDFFLCFAFPLIVLIALLMLYNLNYYISDIKHGAHVNLTTKPTKHS